MLKLLALALLAVALFFGAHCMTIHKDLIADRQTIDAVWNDVDTALQHRATLVPELTQTVQAQLPPDALVETSAIVGINDARNLLNVAHNRQEKIQANARLDQAVARLMLLVENYPKAEGGKKYRELLESLKNADYQIALARRKYNEAVEHYNARIEIFPNNIVASVAGFQKVDAYIQTPAI